VSTEKYVLIGVGVIILGIAYSEYQKNQRRQEAEDAARMAALQAQIAAANGTGKQPNVGGLSPADAQLIGASIGAFTNLATNLISTFA